MCCEARVGDNHHHLVRRGCGLAVDEAEITFWGICPACTTTPTDTRSAA